MDRAFLIPSLVAGALALGACRTSPTDERVAEVRGGALVNRELRSYHVVYSEHRGPVGFLKVFDVTEGGGPTYPWKYVYDRDWKELGFVDQYGSAYRYLDYSEFEADVQGRSLRLTRLPSDSLERNVMRMLAIDPALDNVTFPPAGRDDILNAAVDSAK